MNFYRSQPSLTLISLIFEFTLTGVYVDILWADIATASTAYEEDKNLLQAAMAEASGHARSSFVVTAISVAEGATGLGNAEITVTFHGSAEELGYTPDTADAAAEIIENELTSAFTTIDSDSAFVMILKRLAGVSSSSISFLMMAVQIGDTFVDTSTSNTQPTFEEPIIQYIRSSTPSLSPTTSGFHTVSDTELSSLPTDTPVVAPTFPTQMRCINLKLMDLFGDGWDSAQLVIYPSYTCQGTNSYAPTCVSNPLYVQHCFNSDENEDGDYVVLMVVGYDPDQPWEILWKATDIHTKNTYTGDYDTTMVFTFHKSLDRTQPGANQLETWIELTNSVALLDTTATCKSCMIETSTDDLHKSGLISGKKGSPRSRGRRILLEKDYYEEREREDTRTSFNLLNGVHSLTRSLTWSSPPPPERPSKPVEKREREREKDEKVGVPANPPQERERERNKKSPRSIIPRTGSEDTIKDISLSSSSASFSPLSPSLSGHEDTWYNTDGTGAKYYITFADGGLYFSGTLCPSSLSSLSSSLSFVSHKVPSKSCNIDFQDGSYYWRVTGALSNQKEDIQWNFCGETGGASSEMYFLVKNGKCKVYGGVTYVEDMPCDSDVSLTGSDVSLDTTDQSVKAHGVLQIKGQTSPSSSNSLSLSSTEVIKKALNEELADAFLSLSNDNNKVKENSILSIFDVSSSYLSSNQEEKNIKNKRILIEKESVYHVQFVMHLSSSVEMFSLKKYLERSLTSGLFITRLHRLSSTSSDPSLLAVTSSSLLNLQILHEKMENRTFSLLATVVIIICGVSGLVFSILLMLSYDACKNKTLYQNGGRYATVLTQDVELSITN